mmetsp:Transcript_125122/g.350371  ORF Transcript_125122/g.350371 Transcript_125122/m.350371 type:complete len:227 (-) Transcript_125122:756-1436(-)
MVNWVKQLPKTEGVKSGTAGVLNQHLFSSSVSSTFGGCGSGGSSSIFPSSSSSSLSSSTFFSSSFSPSSFCSSPAASCATFLSASSCSRFCRFAARSALLFSTASSRCLFLSKLFCFSSRSFFWNSASAAACFSFNKAACARSLNILSGSPMTTCATRWKCGMLKGFSAASRSSFMRLPFTSIKTRFRCWVAAMALKILEMPPSSNCGMPKCRSGLSLEKPGVGVP